MRETVQGDEGRSQVMGHAVDEGFQFSVSGLQVGQQPSPLLLRPLALGDVVKNALNISITFLIFFHYR